MDGEEEKGQTERGDGQDVQKNKAPDQISEGEKKRNPNDLREET